MAPQLYNSPQPTYAASSAAFTRRQGTTLLNRNCFFNSPISHQGTTISSSCSSRGSASIKCATSVSGLSATTTSTTPSISSFNEVRVCPPPQNLELSDFIYLFIVSSGFFFVAILIFEIDSLWGFFSSCFEVD